MIRVLLCFSVYAVAHEHTDDALTRTSSAASEQQAAVAMRSIFYSVLSLATIASTLAVPDNAAAAAAAKRADADDDWEEKVPDTIFNGQTVPPMPVLDVKNMDTEISKGNWYAYGSRIRGHMLICPQACRILLALVPSLRTLCAYLPDSLRILLHIEAHRRKRRARGRLAQLIQTLLRLQLCQGGLHSIR